MPEPTPHANHPALDSPHTIPASMHATTPSPQSTIYPTPKPRITMRIVDWWKEDNERNFYANPLIQILQSRFDIAYAKEPDFLLYSAFGREHLRFSCPRIFYTGENIRTNWSFADYALDFDFMEFGERHLYFSIFWLFSQDIVLASQKHLHAERFAASKERFCAFLASNPNGDPMRAKLFDAIHAYKRVDSAGKWLNNTPPIGGRNGDFAQAKRRWLASYRFNLCPENSSHKGYLTEKIIQAHASGCIPIYWGDETLCDPRYDSYRPTLNPKALINAHDYATLEELVEAIKRIDADENLYRAMLQEPAFLPSDKWGIQWGGGLHTPQPSSDPIHTSPHRLACTSPHELACPHTPTSVPSTTPALTIALTPTRDSATTTTRPSLATSPAPSLRVESPSYAQISKATTTPSHDSRATPNPSSSASPSVSSPSHPSPAPVDSPSSCEEAALPDPYYRLECSTHPMLARARLEVLEFFSAIFTSPTPKQIRFSQRLLAERKDLAILERRKNLYRKLTLPLRALKDPKHYLHRLKEKLGF